MKKTVRLLISLIFISFFNYSHAGAADPFSIKRLAGKSRIETSIEISKESYKQSKNVILAGFNGQADALAASLFASLKDAPILFVSEASADLVKNYLEELQAEKVYILGGREVFSDKLYSEFKLYKPERISGKDRYATAVKLAEKSLADYNSVDEVFISSGQGGVADALAIGPVSAKYKKPLLLSSEKGLSKESKIFLKNKTIKKVTIIGGEIAVPKIIEEELKKLDIKVTRLSGKNRELTALSIAEKYKDDFTGILVTNGWSSVDASAGGYFGAKKNSLILFSSKNKIKDSVLNYIENNKAPIYLLGGLNVLDETIEEKLKTSLTLEHVLNEAEFNDALDNFNIKTIKLSRNINLEKTLFINRSVTIDGNLKEIKAPMGNSDQTNSYENYTALSVNADNVSLKNLTIKDGDIYNLEFLDVKGAYVENLTLKDSRRMGAIIHSSQVEMKDIKTINNANSGLVVAWDKITPPKLVLSGKNIHQSPKGTIYSVIDIWNTDQDPGWVKAKGYKEFGVARGEPSGFGDSYYYYDIKEYNNWMKTHDPSEPLPY